METNRNEGEKKEGEKKSIVMIAIIVLLVANGLLLWQFFSKKTQVETLTEETVTLTTSRDSVVREYKGIKAELDVIQIQKADLQNKLTLNEAELQAQAEKIEKLIKAEANVNAIKAEIATLKNLKSQYETKITELEQANQILKSKNQELDVNLTEVKSKNENLSQENVKLANKVAIGSILKADAVTAMGVRFKSSGKEVIVKKAKDAEKIKICFTILENVITEKGKKAVYVRVLGPDNSILSASAETFNYNGQPIPYTTTEDFNYDNKKQDLCMYWPKGSAYSKGNYTVEIYVDGSQIGTSTFELK